MNKNNLKFRIKSHYYRFQFYEQQLFIYLKFLVVFQYIGEAPNGNLSK